MSLDHKKLSIIKWVVKSENTILTILYFYYRALQVYEDTGELMSAVLDRQHQIPGASDISGPLRYPNTAVIWIKCDQNGDAVLTTRLKSIKYIEKKKNRLLAIYQ